MKNMHVHLLVLTLVLLGFLIQQGECTRNLLGTVRAPPGGTASVPFSSWPATPPEGFAELIEDRVDFFLAAVPDSLDEAFGALAEVIPSPFGLPFGDIFGSFTPVISQTAGTGLTSTGLTSG
eukprot:CAMPEP_0198234160 /NCGR_PEP_ID=MMETSP1446-20131203/235_1 /TAXON_ID=1461542 ORGANISM="Unidentified sp, Strain CCMP2111" /NCGR_SAMPLE_ID=MMETSP1446 /ASSEMBLY_ACC=CAM_ASM_001112 /LENGTH=121 /DNA_ID=CAMNT_0043914897 /DNA_START=309 /DNA_END=674 /DNA_ORIENTATION=+